MLNTPKKLLIVQTKAPFGSSSIQESLDIVLAAGTFDQDITLLLEEDACFQLLDKQHPELINKKNTTKMLKALPIYGIEKILVCSKSLTSRNISLPQGDNFQAIDQCHIKKLYKESDNVIRF